MDVRNAYADSPVAPLLVVADGDALIGLYFRGYRYTPPRSAWSRRVPCGREHAAARGGDGAIRQRTAAAGVTRSHGSSGTRPARTPDSVPTRIVESF